MELKNLQMEIITKGNIKKESSMEKESIVGLMVLHMKEILLKGYDMVKEAGNHPEKQVIFISGATKTIKNVVTVDIYGLMDVSMKDILETILSKFKFI